MTRLSIPVNRFPNFSHASYCIICESSENNTSVSLLPPEILSPVSAFNRCDVLQATDTPPPPAHPPSTHSPPTTELPSSSSKLQHAVTQGNLANLGIKFSWKCKECRHYNSGHSDKCSFCIRFYNSPLSSFSNNSNRCSYKMTDSKNRNMVGRSSGGMHDMRGVDSTSHSQSVDSAMPPVEEVEQSMMVDNNLYFLGRGGNVVSNLDYQGNVASTARNPSFRRETKEQTKARAESEETWLCKRCTFINHSDFKCCEACDAPRRPKIPTTLSKGSQDKKKESSAAAPPVIDLSKSPVKESQMDTLDLKYMWTCSKCSYAFNPKWSKCCDMCNVSKNFITERTREVLKQNLDDDFQILTTDVANCIDYSPEQWSCIKCTLLNPGTENVCKACDGSRIRSLSQQEEATLKKGQFWVCVVCTLKNAPSSRRCKACKARVDGSGGTKEKLLMDHEDMNNQRGGVVFKSSQSFDNNTITKRDNTSHLSRSDSDPYSTIPHERMDCSPTRETSEQNRSSVPPYPVDTHAKSNEQVEPEIKTSLQLELPAFGSGPPSSGSPSKRTGGSWACSACTLVNAPNAISCALCGTSPTLGDIVASSSRPGSYYYYFHPKLGSPHYFCIVIFTVYIMLSVQILLYS